MAHQADSCHTSVLRSRGLSNSDNKDSVDVCVTRHGRHGMPVHLTAPVRLVGLWVRVIPRDATQIGPCQIYGPSALD